MRSKRHKHVKRTLSFYKQYFNYEPPYTVVVDGTFCKAALKARFNILDMLPKYLDAQVNIRTTRCILKECEAFGSMLYGPLKILQQYDIISCKHEEPKPASVCMLKFARKKGAKRCLLATQDDSLCEKVRDIPGTPILTMVHDTLTLESPSVQTQHEAKMILSRTTAPKDHHLEVLKALKRQAFGPKPDANPNVNATKKKQKGPKGPKGVNPLACKKKKKEKIQIVAAQSKAEDGETKKRRKRRKRKFGAGAAGES